MLNFIRHTIFLRFIWAILGMHILNFSINIADNIPINQKEDLTINEQESVIEFIIEKVLGDSDAFTEYDDIDPDDHSSKKQTNIQFHLSTYFSNPEFSAILFTSIDKSNFSYNQSIIEGISSPNNPPPKHC